MWPNGTMDRCAGNDCNATEPDRENGTGFKIPAGIITLTFTAFFTIAGVCAGIEPLDLVAAEVAAGDPPGPGVAVEG